MDKESSGHIPDKYTIIEQYEEIGMDRASIDFWIVGADIFAICSSEQSARSIRIGLSPRLYHWYGGVGCRTEK